MKGLMNLGIRSYIMFDVLGRKITAKVTSIRKFDAKNTEPHLCLSSSRFSEKQP